MVKNAKTYPKGNCWCCGCQWSNDPSEQRQLKDRHRWLGGYQSRTPEYTDGLVGAIIIAGTNQWVCEDCDKQIKRQKGVGVGFTHFKQFRKNEEKYLAGVSVRFRLWESADTKASFDEFHGPRKLTPAGNPVGGKLHPAS